MQVQRQRERRKLNKKNLLRERAKKNQNIVLLVSKDKNEKSTERREISSYYLPSGGLLM